MKYALVTCSMCLPLYVWKESGETCCPNEAKKKNN